VNFYEKALFVKVDVATALWWTQPLCALRALCFYPRSLGELTLSLVARRIMGSVFSGQRRCNLPIGLPGRVDQVHSRSRLMLDPKRVRARTAVAIRHCGVTSPLYGATFTSFVLGCAPSPPFKLPTSKLPPLALLGVDACCRVDRRPLP